MVGNMPCRKLCAVGVVIVLFIVLLSITACEGGTNEKDIKLREVSLRLVVNEEKEVKILGADCELSVLDTGIASVDKDGKVKAIKSGKTELRAKAGDKMKSLPIEVYDTIASNDIKEDDPMLGKSKFFTVAEAVEKAPEGGSVFIETGRYGEKLTVDKSISIVADKNVVINSMRLKSGNRLNLTGLTFYNKNYPDAGDATLYAESNAVLTVLNCDFFIDKKNDTKDERIGGYCIYVAANSSFVQIRRCNVSNYYYGIFVEGTDGKIDIQENNITNVTKGIGVDIEKKNTTLPENYSATGSISFNDYNEVEVETEFLFAGAKYDGELDFADYKQGNRS